MLYKLDLSSQPVFHPYLHWQLHFPLETNKKRKHVSYDCLISSWMCLLFPDDTQTILNNISKLTMSQKREDPLHEILLSQVPSSAIHLVRAHQLTFKAM